jgi:hypothetical protein
MSSVVLISSDDSTPAKNLPVVDYSAPAPARQWAATFFLQISHRIGAVALLATIGTWASMYLIHDFHLPLAIAGGCADVGFCSAMIARLLTRSATASRREANGAAIFNLVLFVLAIYLMIFARLDVIRAAASEFFTPTPPVVTH